MSGAQWRSVLARAVYGARADTGIAYFAKAFAADPKNLVIRFQICAVPVGL